MKTENGFQYKFLKLFGHSRIKIIYHREMKYHYITYMVLALPQRCDSRNQFQIKDWTEENLTCKPKLTIKLCTKIFIKYKSIIFCQICE